MNSRAVNQCVQHIGFIKRYVVRRVPIPEVVEDISQQVIADFLAKVDSFEIKDDIRPLLMGMAQKAIATYWREHAKRSQETLFQIARHLQQINQEELLPQVYDEQMDVLKKCLESLPTHGRSLIDMYYFEELTSSEMAQLFRKKKESVVRAIHRIREKLRLCVEKKTRKGARGYNG